VTPANRPSIRNIRKRHTPFGVHSPTTFRRHFCHISPPIQRNRRTADPPLSVIQSRTLSRTAWTRRRAQPHDAGAWDRERLSEPRHRGYSQNGGGHFKDGPQGSVAASFAMSTKPGHRLRVDWLRRRHRTRLGSPTTSGTVLLTVAFSCA
jgi:hypothetical protein